MSVLKVKALSLVIRDDVRPVSDSIIPLQNSVTPVKPVLSPKPKGKRSSV